MKTSRIALWTGAALLGLLCGSSASGAEQADGAAEVVPIDWGGEKGGGEKGTQLFWCNELRPLSCPAPETAGHRRGCILCRRSSGSLVWRSGVETRTGDRGHPGD